MRSMAREEGKRQHGVCLHGTATRFNLGLQRRMASGRLFISHVVGHAIDRIVGSLQDVPGVLLVLGSRRDELRTVLPEVDEVPLQNDLHAVEHFLQDIAWCSGGRASNSTM